MILSILLLLLLTACNFAEVESQPQSLPTSTTVRVVAQVTPVPTISRRLQDVATVEPESQATEAPTATPIPSCDTAAETRAAHTVQAELDYRQQSVGVNHQIRYVNVSDNALEQLVLDVEPNRLPSVFQMESLLVGEAAPPTYELTGRRLVIELSEPLGVGCSVELQLQFRLQIPQIGVGMNGLTGYFGFSARQINLGHWLPTMAVLRNGEWLLHENPGVGEQTVADPSDWDVTIKVNGASESLQVVGPGEASQPEPGVWHFIHTDARDFTVTMSERFQRLEQVAENGVTVELYTFDDASNGTVNGAEHALDVATRSLAMYSDLFGNYPRERFIVVQGDFPDGMEFSDLVFVSGDWFRSYDGTPAGYLTIITVHEVAHQWWYSRVGNDQAMTPWLDEALATYSEYIFYEEYYPDMRDWWWRFRVNAWIPEGFDDSVASSVYEFTSVREYINAVYLRGARMLHDLRRDVGTDAFFGWLRQYADAGQGQVATPDLFWSLLSEAQQEATHATRERYLSVTTVADSGD